jgi:hypothetical protein
MLRRKCPNCSIENELRADFCRNCRWPLKGAMAAGPKPRCSRCGTKLEPGLANCPGCGGILDWGPQK